MPSTGLNSLLILFSYNTRRNISLLPPFVRGKTGSESYLSYFLITLYSHTDNQCWPEFMPRQFGSRDRILLITVPFCLLSGSGAGCRQKLFSLPIRLHLVLNGHHPNSGKVLLAPDLPFMVSVHLSYLLWPLGVAQIHLAL